MSLLDLTLQTAKLTKELRGSRVVNIYDANNGRTYILKLSVPPQRNNTAEGNPSDSKAQPGPPSLSKSWEKKLLLLESGIRIHMTEFDREKDLPTGFSLKLRKHIRARRLECVRHLGDGGDRIIELVFSREGKTCAHLIMELFSGGQIILADENYIILALLRNYRQQEGKEDAKISVRERYPIERVRKATPMTAESFKAAVQKCLANMPTEEKIAAAQNRAFRKKMRGMTIARRALAGQLSLEPALLEHALHSTGLDAEISLTEFCQGDNSDRAFQALHDLQVRVAKLIEEGKTKGYVILKVVEEKGKRKELYDEFSPYLYSQFTDRVYKEYDNFDEAADDFFSTIEASKAEATQAKREVAALNKVDKLASELNGQLSIFENVRDSSWKKARAIENNLWEVEAAITVVRSAIAAAVSWDGLAEMVEQEKLNGNPIAEIIHSLHLERNEITLMLERNDEDEEGEDEDSEATETEEVEDDSGEDDDEDEVRKSKRKHLKSSAESREVLLVSVDLSLGAYQNARNHYEQRKNAAAKRDKAAQANNRTLKAASKKAVNEAHKVEAKAAAASIRARRKVLWFEKFYWFVSSENYLVVAGHDVQQNELLVKRYLGRADIYVTADLPRAASVIVKNRKLPGTNTYNDIPQMTLEQAGTFAMCRSTAWDSKMVTSAWWVRASQISKMTASGDYLPVGNFVIRGKKNFLDPTQLVMGLAFLFKVDESSIENHKGERAVRGLEDISDSVGDKQPANAKNEPHEQSSTPQLQIADVNAGDTVPADDLINTTEEEEEKEVSPVVLVGDQPVEPSATVQKMDVDKNEPQRQLSREDIQTPSAIASVEGGKETSPNEAATATAEEPSEPSVKAPRGKKKHLSAKQRRALRNAMKGGGQAGPSVETATGAPDSGAAYGPVIPRQKQEPASKGSGPLPRGRKHKLKKMKKYQDQDEDERRIALALLGAKPVAQAASNSTGENQGETSEGTQDDGGEGRSNDRKLRKQQEERQETMWLMDEEGLLELDKLEEETVKILGMLTAVPSKEDTVEYAMPVCAPYSALSQYRYKAKVMHGNSKRGKAYRAAAMVFVKQAEKDLDNLKEDRDAMRLCPEADGVRNMLGNVHIMGPGMASANKALQKGKKGSNSKKSKK